MKIYLVRDNDEYKPLAMFPASDSLDAGLIMRKNFTNKPVHLLNVTNWPHKKREATLIQIIANCPIANLSHFPN